MALKLITAPDGEPVTLAQAKNHLEVTFNDRDVLIAGLISSAREQAEMYTGRVFLTQTWDYMLDEFPYSEYGEISLPNPPLQSVTSVNYVDQAGVEQTLSSSLYLVDTSSQCGRIAPAYGQVWPYARCQLNAVTVRMVCGYGNAAKVPFSIAAAMLLIIGELFKNREETMPGVVADLPRGVESLLSPYRVVRF